MCRGPSGSPSRRGHILARPVDAQRLPSRPGMLTYMATVGLGLVALGSTARAWSPLRDVDGLSLSWPSSAGPIPLADAERSWARAAVRWSRAGAPGFWPVGSVALGDDGTTTLARIGDPQVWRDLVGDPALVGFTIVSHDRGRMRDADVVLNAAHFRWDEPGTSGGFSAETVLAHEMGHVVGLGHACGPPESVSCFALESNDARIAAAMFPHISPGDSPRTPNEDDQMGLAALYPAASQGPSLELRAVSHVPSGTWRIEIDGLEPSDAVRLWGPDRWVRPLRVESGVAIFELEARYAAEALDLEAWSTTGQGLYRSDVIPPGPGPAATVDDRSRSDPDTYGEPPTRSSGCQVADPQGSTSSNLCKLAALMLVALIGPSRRRSCPSTSSR